MESFYYECIYDVLRGNRPHKEKLTELIASKQRQCNYAVPPCSG
jgi:hypothetical protein